MEPLKLGPYNITIERPVLEEKTYGSYEGFPDAVIKIDGRLDGKTVVLTLIHELFEAVIDMYDMPLDETHVRILELTVGRFIEDNSEAVRDWVDVLSSP